MTQIYANYDADNDGKNNMDGCGGGSALDEI